MLRISINNYCKNCTRNLYMHNVYIHLKTGVKIIFAIFKATIHAVVAALVEFSASFREQLADITTEHVVDIAQVKLDKNDKV